MFEPPNPPPMSPMGVSPHGREPTHDVNQLIEADGQIYRMHVGHGWSLVDGGDVFKIVTINAEYEITRRSDSNSIH